MDDFLIDQYLWVAIFGNNPTSMKYEEWVVLEKKGNKTYQDLFVRFGIIENL